MTELARFLEFLVARDQVSREEAKELQEKFPLFIGLLAVKRGFLSYKRVQDILERQKIFGGTFGEVACQMEWLSQDQVQTLLADQRAQVDMVGRTLVGTTLTAKQFRDLKEEFESCPQDASATTPGS